MTIPPPPTPIRVGEVATLGDFLRRCNIVLAGFVNPDDAMGELLENPPMDASRRVYVFEIPQHVLDIPVMGGRVGMVSRLRVGQENQNILSPATEGNTGQVVHGHVIGVTRN
jgi:hypothetical protein